LIFCHYSKIIQKPTAAFHLSIQAEQAGQGNNTVAQELREVLILEVGGQRYGLPVADVQELLRMVTLTPLPSGPPIVEGVINVRGKVVPVLDLRTRFRLPAKAADHTDHVAGLQSVRQAGGTIIAQDESSSVIFGMPGAAVAAGLADMILPLDILGARLVELVESQ
jgi:purine-binding chemotaxis protein CheW